MIRCEICHRPVDKETLYMHWLTVVHFIEFLSLEEYIEENTYKKLMDSLLALKNSNIGELIEEDE